MLCNLYVKNLALLSSLSVDFEEGFSVLTGETGAGKSLILDSLNLFLQKGSPRDLIRNGEEECTVSLFFDSLPPAAREKLSEIAPGADPEEGVTLSRTLSRSGKSVCRAAGRTVSLSALRSLALTLFFIHGQHDAAGLLDPSTHLSYLDASLSPKEKEALSDYRAAFADYRALCDEKDRILSDQRDPDAAAAYYDFQIREITKARVTPGEEEELTRRLAVLRDSEKIHNALATADRALSGGEKGRGAAALLEIAAARMESIASLPAYAAFAETLRGLAGEVQSAAEEGAALFAELNEEDPGEETDRIQRRLDHLYRLKTKYGATEQEILDFLDRVTREKEQLLTRKDRLSELEKKIAALREVLTEKARVLTRIRLEKKKELEAGVHRVLAFLDMEKTRFDVRVAERTDFGADGRDQVEFFFAPNAGEAEKPLAAIASGGELSRVMLALQLKLGADLGVGTLIFDEIDTGISGATAQKIGICLKKLAASGQIFCVTHSAQVASLADVHYLVSKSEKDGRTETAVRRLSEEESLAELARILGGRRIGAATLGNAAALKEEGRREFDKQKNLL